MDVPALDSSRPSRRDLRVRALSALLVVTFALPAFASARVQVGPFALAGERSQALGFFGPEVARAVGEALAARGVEVGPRSGSADRPSARSPDGTAEIVGRIETSSGDRVRLLATVRGKTVAVSGPLDGIDRLAAELADRLLPLVADTGAQRPSLHAPKMESAVRARPPRAEEARRSESETPTLAQKIDPAPSAELAARVPSAVASPSPTSTSTSPSPSPSASTTSEAPATAPAPQAAAPAKEEPASADAAPATAAPPAAATPPPVSRPAPPVVADAAPPPPPEARPPARTPGLYYPRRYGYGFGRRFVVAHTIPDIPTAFRGSGAAATQAFYAFLRQRLRVQYVPTGVGLVPLPMAIDEGLRSGAQAVVMARLLGVEYLPVRAGQSVRCRLEVVVVRDGRPILRRVVQSQPTDPGPPGLRHGRDYDPIFMAVYQALDTIGPDLGFALSGLR